MTHVNENVHCPKRGLCPDCGSPVTHERDVQECGGVTVRECASCGWTDFDELERAHWIRVNSADPLAAMIDG